MKASKENSLSNRLHQYATTAGAILTLGPMASGQLVWSDIQNIFVDNPVDPFELDMNSDGTDDFILGIALSSTYWNHYTSFNSAFIRNARTDSYYNSWLVDQTELNQVLAFDSSEIIDSDMNYMAWTNTGNTWNIGSYNRTNQNAMGSFAGLGNRFIGIRFFFGEPAMHHYGWIRINVPFQSDRIKILDWCFEATAEEAIMTGGVPVIISDLISPFCSNSLVFNLNLIFNDAIQSLGSEHFLVSNGEVTNIQTILPGVEYLIEITASVEGKVNVELIGETIESVSGEPVISSNVNTLVDLTPPVVTLDVSSPLISEPIGYVIVSADEPVEMPEETDFQIENGTIDGISPFSPTTYEITVVALAPGTVTITLLEGSLANNCGLTNAESSSYYIYDPSVQDVNTQSIDGILIYPNPANSQLHIELNEAADIYIFNMTGQRIYSSQYITTEIIDISQLPKGLYMVCIIGNDRKILYKKVIIE